MTTTGQAEIDHDTRILRLPETVKLPALACTVVPLLTSTQPAQRATS